MHFRVAITGRDPYYFRNMCQGYVDALWIPSHYTPEQAAAFALDQFRRSVLLRLEAVWVEVEPDVASGRSRGSACKH